MNLFKKKETAPAAEVSAEKSKKNKVKKPVTLNIFDFTQDNAITVKDLDLYYGEFQALKKINMQMPKYQITAMIGPSGCGKSTLIKTLNRMNDLVEGCRVEGEIMIGGLNIYDKGVDLSALRKNVGMVFQKPNPFPMSVYGGQQQRLCIARALAVGPQILLMDEPTSALDPISTGKIEELCEELKKDVTIVMVTHNMQQAARISDKTAFFLLGEMIEMGDTEQVFSEPRHPETERYITGRFG